MSDFDEIYNVAIEPALNEPFTFGRLPEDCIVFWVVGPAIFTLWALKYVGPWGGLSFPIAWFACYIVTELNPGLWRRILIHLKYFGHVSVSSMLNNTIVLKP